MEDNDLGSKKMNNEQKVNEGFSGNNMDLGNHSGIEKLKQETEIDKDGNIKIVERARNVEETHEETHTKWNEDESLSRGVANEDLIKKTIENKDRNSDITMNRYPNSSPDNHENRGNIKLNEE